MRSWSLEDGCAGVTLLPRPLRRPKRNSRGLVVSFGRSNLQTLRNIWLSDEGQDIAEYAVMLAVILIVVIGAVRLIGGNANNAFSAAASNLN